MTTPEQPREAAAVCPQCGYPVATAEDVIDGRADYYDTQGGHNDRHTLVVEAADRATRPGARP